MPDAAGQPLRICYLARANYTGLQRIAGHMARRGNEVHVVTLHPAEVEGCRVHGLAAGGRLPGIAKYVAAMPAVRRQLGRIAPQVVDAHGLTSYGLFAHLELPCPLVTTVYGPDLYLHGKSYWPARVVARRAVERSAMIFVSAAATRGYIQSILGVDPGERLQARSWGVQLGPLIADSTARRAAVRRRLGVAEGTKVLLHSRHIAPLWRVAVLVEAAAEVLAEHPDSELWLAYPPPNRLGRRYLAGLRRRAAELGIAERVRWLGQQTYYEIISLMHAADVWVCVGEHDLLPSSLLEAMATGMVPVLADLPAYREVVEHGVNGFLLADPTPPALAAELGAVLGDLAAIRPPLAARNQVLLRQRYDEDATAEWLDAQYRRLAAR